jgi:hypothetical protein
LFKENDVERKSRERNVSVRGREGEGDGKTRPKERVKEK